MTKQSYTSENIQRIIRHIPVIIGNFKQRIPIELLAQQMQCDQLINEEIIRLGFVANFPLVNPLNDNQTDDSET